MKKIYLSILSLAIIGTASAQVKTTGGPVKKTDGKNEIIKPSTNNINNETKVLIWSNDFSNAADWGFTNTSVPALDWNWTNDHITSYSMSIFRMGHQLCSLQGQAHH